MPATVPAHAVAIRETRGERRHVHAVTPGITGIPGVRSGQQIALRTTEMTRKSTRNERSNMPAGGMTRRSEEHTS